MTANGVDGTDVLWKDRFDWSFEEDELAFLRLAVYHDKFAKDSKIVLFCAKLDHIQQGWRFIRMMDIQGKNSGALLLVNFKITTTVEG